MGKRNNIFAAAFISGAKVVKKVAIYFFLATEMQIIEILVHILD